MRTLALLAALLLLASQAQARTLQESVDQLPAQDQPGDEDLDEDVAISFVGQERLAREAAGHRGTITCTCRRGGCQGSERPSGTCILSGVRYTLCCR